MKKLLIGLVVLNSLTASAAIYKCTVNTGKISTGRDRIIVSKVEIEANGEEKKLSMKGSKVKGVILSIGQDTNGNFMANATLKENLNDGVSTNIGVDITVQTQGLPGSILSAGVFDFKKDQMYNLYCVPKK